MNTDVNIPIVTIRGSVRPVKSAPSSPSNIFRGSAFTSGPSCYPPLPLAVATYSTKKDVRPI